MTARREYDSTLQANINRLEAETKELKRALEAKMQELRDLYGSLANGVAS